VHRVPAPIVIRALDAVCSQIIGCMGVRSREGLELQQRNSDVARPIALLSRTSRTLR